MKKLPTLPPYGLRPVSEGKEITLISDPDSVTPAPKSVSIGQAGSSRAKRSLSTHEHGSIPEIITMKVTRRETSSSQPLKRANAGCATVFPLTAQLQEMKRVKSQESFFEKIQQGGKIEEDIVKVPKKLKNNVWDIFLIPNMSPCSSPPSSPVLRRKVRISAQDLDKATTEARASAELSKELLKTKASLLIEKPNIDEESLERAVGSAKGRLVRQRRFSKADTEARAKPEKKDSPRTVNRKAVQNILGNILHQEEILESCMSMKGKKQAEENLSLLLVVLIKEVRNSSFSDRHQLFQFIKAYNQTIISTLNKCALKFMVEEAVPNFYLLCITDYAINHAQVFNYSVDYKMGIRPSVAFSGDHLKEDWTYLIEKGWPFENKKF